MKNVFQTIMFVGSVIGNTQHIKNAVVYLFNRIKTIWMKRTTSDLGDRN